MKKTFLAILMIAYQSSFACDACGCSGMMIGFGNLSFYNQNSLGLRSNFRQFNSEGIRDSYSLIALNGDYFINERWGLSLNLPYLIATRNTADNLEHINGLSDISLKARYFIYRSSKNELSSRLNFNVGLNFPTGIFEARENSLLPDNFQIGTGSLDYLFELEYQLIKKNWVTMFKSSYLLNTLNPHAYKFGNQTNVNITGAYKFSLEKVALLPLLNLAYEHFAPDINSRSFYQFGTGGEGVTIMTGLQFKIRKLMLGLQSGTNLYRSQTENYNPGMQINFSCNYLF